MGEPKEEMIHQNSILTVLQCPNYLLMQDGISEIPFGLGKLASLCTP